MAQAFVRTFKRDYARVRPCCPNAQIVLQSLSAWFTHYNEVRPHRALGYQCIRSAVDHALDQSARFHAHRHGKSHSAQVAL
jgi:putative transposase